MIKRFTPNTVGTDYICSDIHGHFHILETMLSEIGFNAKVDRLFSLGDMIDRGEESDRALEWLKKPWFHAIQGNHERMLINAFESQSDILRHQWLAWGGEWAEDLSNDEIEPFYNAFLQLPIAIEIELKNNLKVGLVHAELPDVCDWLDIVKALHNAGPEHLESSLEISDMLWKKTQPYLKGEEIKRIEPVKNIDHVFHGHTIVDHYLTLSNRTFMDLGSYKTGRIGIIEAAGHFTDH